MRRRRRNAMPVGDNEELGTRRHEELRFFEGSGVNEEISVFLSVLVCAMCKLVQLIIIIK